MIGRPRSRPTSPSSPSGASAMPRTPVRAIALALLVAFSTFSAARADTKTLARCGQGFLEEVDGYRVLHVKGTPYEMGYQQGALLKDDIREGIRFLFEV